MNVNRIAKDEGLTIEYALTRREIFRSFLQSIAESSKFRGTILLYSAAIGVLTLLPKAVLSRTLTLKDAATAVAWAIGAFLFIPVGVFIFGKTSKRTLTISPDGISTEIGRLRAEVPWKKVRVVTETPQFVLIVGASGNAFFIPRRAFTGPDHQAYFVAEMNRCMEARTHHQVEVDPS